VGGPAFAVLLFAVFTGLAAGCAYWMVREAKGERAGWWAAGLTLVALTLLGAGVLGFVRGLP
jgi:asparagine N-glycosylation enzyme membrane subunit Stt3